MKYALLALIATLGASMGAQAMPFTPAAISSEVTSSDGCGNIVWHAADRTAEPFSCCRHEFGCAQFLATTRVETHRRTPRT